MAEMETEFISQDEVESPLQSDQQPQDDGIPSLGRQASIYSLTLDEFQNTICENGKNFGSMNMDEFLNSIWTAEENQTQAQAQTCNINTNNENTNNPQFSLNQISTEKGIDRQPSLPRQGSFTIPPPLSNKTVEEVWSEIHKGQQEQKHGEITSVHDPNSAQRQTTFGEMTLEDFLVKAGVVREQCNTPLLPQQPFGLYQTNNVTTVGPGFVSTPLISLGGGVNLPSYPAMSQGGIGELSGYAVNGKRSVGYQPQPLAVCYGGRVGNGGGGYGQVQGLGSPASPVSSDGMCATIQIDNVNQYGMDIGAIRGGRKRIIDGPVEKVVERRQRRMIKNRESAARSRARKQAYTVELEAELNQLKEENAQLRHALVELERKAKQQHFEEVKMRTQTSAQNTRERLKAMRRALSCQF
ncbi:protein ABSCISIC ACID-INSENSITIVE 5 [Cornus florida]|uniref:protein ABSCISIC ACID-INSENSITIVE 5 n=1 Tax=Cornus florida TaxID=4283 RepID=UPI002897A806|nr:protein ABSCISIC ACID-INSENSITIVE 5 [Cornus florida]XP_059643267.1 protein ABSCISIC ACID-INSENSITIVE 5 [Cornus florida]